MKVVIPDKLVVVLAHRWSLPVLAELARSEGAKFSSLRVKLACSRDSLVTTLRALQDEGLVIRNPGYGHPMRPEYLLTDSGARLAPVCGFWLEKAKLTQGDALTRWCLPVLILIGAGTNRFAEIRRELDAAPSAVSTSLRDLTGRGVIVKRLADTWPATLSYHLTRRGISWHQAALILVKAFGQPTKRRGGVPALSRRATIS
jgi:DNA-binding HxlR family transcriptional regulator